MEAAECIVIVGAGIAGLTTALGLHRLGIRSLVLESSDKLRTTGFAFSTWPNAWRALDAVGIGDSLRLEHKRLFRLKTYSTISGTETSNREFAEQGKTQSSDSLSSVGFETRCIQRKNLLETLARELPSGTIRYSSKVVSIEESGHLKLVHLADGSILKAKVLIGCDGLNSAVSKWLGFNKPVYSGRSAIRGCVSYSEGHGLDPNFMQFFGRGVRFGVIPCDDTTVYWFFTFSPSSQDHKEMEDDPAKMKQFVLSRLGKVPDHVRGVIERSEPRNTIMSPLRYRRPWEVAWGNISKGTVCVAGDAFHPMTPDLGQGGCSALEDGVVLARCLGQALIHNSNNNKLTAEDERKHIEAGLENYARERRWRGFELITTAFMVGYIQQSDGKVLSFMRDRILATFLAGRLLSIAAYDCGKLNSS
ncbi:hypothetical protein SAY87_007307 [Trapa incisa]|uniref:FAD-binding domain-containing protein n=1 Tax=Trapa incisa TaxID=236973 RepID=A0AAN7K468_9MYRT|nr:hypothetical protein SAY87_007307 [Trapa incisa]